MLSLALVVERMSAGGVPFGLEVPSLRPGAEANLCLIDLHADWEVGEAGYESRSTNSCFAGQRLIGRVRLTMAGGVVAYRERSFALGVV